MDEGWIVECRGPDGMEPWLELEPAEPPAIARAGCPVWPDEASAEAHADTFRQKFPDKVFGVRPLTEEEAGRLATP